LGFEKTLVTTSARESFEILKSQKIQFMGNGYLPADFFDHDFAVAEFPRRTDNTQNFFHAYHLIHTTIPVKVGCFMGPGIFE
jgi:hypothetical protein